MGKFCYSLLTYYFIDLFLIEKNHTQYIVIMFFCPSNSSTFPQILPTSLPYWSDFMSFIYLTLKK